MLLSGATDDGSSDPSPASSALLNAAPVLTSVSSSSANSAGAFMGVDAVVIAGAFSDVDLLDTHAVSIDWGDGSTDAGSVAELAGNGTFSGSHIYQTGGLFTVALTVTDGSGGGVQAFLPTTISGVSFHDGQLEIIGSDGADRIEVSPEGGRCNPGGPLLVEAQFDLPDSEGCGEAGTNVLSLTFDPAEVSRIVMIGRAGHDRLLTASDITIPADIDGGEGDDCIASGAGADTVTDREGKNVIRTGAGDDTVVVLDNDNCIWTDGGDDEVTARDGNNRIDVGTGNNVVTVGEGRNVISAGSHSGCGCDDTAAGNNEIVAGSGDNIIVTGAGDDSIVVGDGNNQITAAGGNNFVVAGNGVNQISAVGSARWGCGAGADGDNYIVTGDGPNCIETGSGDDWIVVGNGDNLIDTAGGNNNIVAGDGDNLISAIVQTRCGRHGDGEGNNDIVVGNGDNAIITGAGDDSIVFGSGDNWIVTGGGVSSIVGGEGNNWISTGNAASRNSRDGSHDCDGRGGGDHGSGRWNHRHHESDCGEATSADGNSDIVVGNGNNVITTGGGDDSIFTGNGNNRISTDGGNDQIDTGDGDNSLDGGAGNDSLTAGAGRDSVCGGAGNDVIFAGAGNDTLSGGNDDDILVGGDGNDVLVAGDGRDLMIGGLGSDNLTGNRNEDVLIAGWTLYDSALPDLAAILSEWTSSSNYTSRVAHLTGSAGGLNGTVFLHGADDAGGVGSQTVFDDNAVDRLTGSQGIDWFLANTTRDNSMVPDIITDLGPGETASDIDLNTL